MSRKNQFEITLYLRLSSVSGAGPDKEHHESVRGLECNILQIYFTVGPITSLPYHEISSLQKCSLANAGVVMRPSGFSRSVGDGIFCFSKIIFKEMRRTEQRKKKMSGRPVRG